MAKMTKDNYEKLQAKLAQLKKRSLEISKIIGEAREHGDLRENSAYHAAKEEQGLNAMRIRDLENQIENAEIVAAVSAGKREQVAVGATVKIMALDSEQEYTYTIVPEIESDPLAGKISTASPVGAALIGHRVGDEVEVEVPRGVVTYKILAIA